MVAVMMFQRLLLLAVFVLSSLQEGCQSFSLPAGKAVVRGGDSPTGDNVKATPTPSESLESAATNNTETEQKIISKKDTLLKEMLAESIGTFLIVNLGTGAVMAAIFDDALVGLFQIASAWIIAVTIAIATTGPISGAHLNPAVSVSFAILRPASFASHKLLPYVAAQLVGAIGGSLVNLIMYREKILRFEAANNIVRSSAESIASAKAFGEYYVVSTGLAFFVELFGTAILAFVVYALTNPKNDTQKNNVYIPPLIGLTVGALIASLAPLTQCGLNPARDFGPRIVAFFAGWKKVAFKGFWVYVLAPICGALVGGYVADEVLYAEED